MNSIGFRFNTFIDFGRSCSGSSGGTDSYSTLWNTGATIGIVVGCLVGAGVLVTIIVVIVCHHKKKSTRVFALQPQPQQMVQTSFVNAPPHQWSPGVFQQPPAYFPTTQANVKV